MKHRYRHSIFGMAIITVLAGCASAPSERSPESPAPVAQAKPPATAPPAKVAPRDERRPTQTAQSSKAARAAADRALSDLAQRLGISQSSIEVLGVQPHYDASSQSGNAGQPAGWNIRLGVGEDVYLYQVDARGALKRLPVSH